MRWRFSWDEWKTRKYRWHVWFAWRPVEVDPADSLWCWLRLVERKRVKDSEIGDWWDYREIEMNKPRSGRLTRSDDWM